MDKPVVSNRRPESSSQASSNFFNPLWRWLDERLGLSAFHYPVPGHANTILYTLGGVTLIGFVIVGVTGFLMSQVYHPHPNEARDSVIYMVTQASFGNLVRSAHFWASNLVVITMLLHLLRVFLAASYKRPRELNWVVGVGLLSLTMGFFFTGTILKWDQEAAEALGHYEALAGLLGNLGNIGTADFTRSVPLLTRLYLVHTSVLAFLFILLLFFHLYLVKYHQISPLPQRGRPSDEGGEAVSSASPGKSSYFSAHLKDMAGYGMILAALVALLSLAFPAVLGAAPIPGIEVTKPPWLFWWPYALENWFGLKALLWATVAFPIAMLVVPFIDRSPLRHILDRKWIGIIALAVVLGWVALTVFVWVTPTVEHLGG